MKNYMEAPATKMLATNCVCCGRALVDADSVAQGIGPECRGGVETLEPDIRKIANEHIYHASIAAMSGHIEKVMEYASLVEKLDDGLAEVAEKMRHRFVKASTRKPDITVEEEGKHLIIRTPFRRGDKQAFIDAWRAIPGREYDYRSKANKIPVTERKAVWSLFKKFFPGKWGKGLKGLFKVVKESKDSYEKSTNGKKS